MKKLRNIFLPFAFLIILLSVTPVFAQTKVPANEEKFIVDLEKELIPDQRFSENKYLTVHINSVVNLLEKKRNLENKNIRLNITVTQPGKDIDGFRVFLGLPNADSNVPTDISEYIGTVSFYGGSPGEETTFMFDLEKFKPYFLQREFSCIKNQKLVLSIFPVRDDTSKSSAASNLILKEVSFVITPDK